MSHAQRRSFLQGTAPPTAAYTRHHGEDPDIAATTDGLTVRRRTPSAEDSALTSAADTPEAATAATSSRWVTESPGFDEERSWISRLATEAACAESPRDEEIQPVRACSDSSLRSVSLRACARLFRTTESASASTAPTSSTHKCRTRSIRPDDTDTSIACAPNRSGPDDDRHAAAAIPIPRR